MLRDSLTGLPNRLSFTETVELRGGEASRDLEHAVLVVDMLRFSRINESMGSLAGDELLITFARRLMSALRAGDVLARTGGNEFGILVGLKRGVIDALAAAERIQDIMSTPFKLSELEIRVECAIGVALMHSSQDAEELFRHAQFAVKQAKAAGKPQVYEPKEASAARRRFSIETELRRALDKDQLKLFYQPLINLKSGEVAGFEALARWTHDDRGEISPTEFIPVAEESGLILQLGRWAMDKAAQTVASWDEAAGGPLPLYVGVNLSAIQVARDNIAEVVESALRSSGLKGERLTLELTESSIVQDPARAMRVFEALKALNATVAMDDFGTGYSSLAYLQRLPIDVLKIDKSFVTGMMRDPDSVAIVRAVLSLADALGMSTTAEGIETVELATTLAALGCSSGQGYYFAKPLEADAALDAGGEGADQLGNDKGRHIAGRYTRETVRHAAHDRDGGVGEAGRRGEPVGGGDVEADRGGDSRGAVLQRAENGQDEAEGRDQFAGPLADARSRLHGKLQDRQVEHQVRCPGAEHAAGKLGEQVGRDLPPRHFPPLSHDQGDRRVEVRAGNRPEHRNQDE
jgi:diguanylate cyclase (GGDEF)-like protein